jgi:hypothetical protein
MPTVSALVRITLDNIKTSDLSYYNNQEPSSDTRSPPCSLEDAASLANSLERLLGLASRRQEDWARVSAYLLADIVHTFQVARLDQGVKAGLVQCCHILLDMCDKHSLDYLAANLPPGTKEIFKQVLQYYNTHHKFTGKV